MELNEVLFLNYDGPLGSEDLWRKRETASATWRIFIDNEHLEARLRTGAGTLRPQG